jgi:hypothetical protein
MRITINGITKDFPENADEMTLGMFVDAFPAVQARQMALAISKITGFDEATINQTAAADIAPLWAILNSSLDKAMAFEEHTEEVTIDGKAYKVELDKDGELSFEQYTDYLTLMENKENILKAMTGQEPQELDYLPLLLKMSLEGNPSIELVRKVKMTEALGISFFLGSRLKQLVKDTKHSSTEEEAAIN